MSNYKSGQDKNDTPYSKFDNEAGPAGASNQKNGRSKAVTKNKGLNRKGSDSSMESVDEKDIVGFIFKVCIVILLMHIFIAGVCILAVKTAFGPFLVKIFWLAIACAVSAIIIVMMFGCCDFMKKSPSNLIFVILLTVCMAIGFATLSAAGENPFAVYVSCFMTLLLLSIVTLYSSWRQDNFSRCSAIGLVFLVAIVVTLIFIIVTSNKEVEVALGCSAPLLYCMCLVIGIGRLKGERAMKLGENGHIIAPLKVYYDIGFVASIICDILTICDDNPGRRRNRFNRW
ncbi:unnamed protein product [Moneuplotes crassus]|uniref:Protein lifeguard 1 n=1 Tax=Euplotes crassus TaxID=5936 RepID=A0AAD2D239_EUPCR|nr:unnamed protein product [Moneuplotes crassus]